LIESTYFAPSLALTVRRNEGGHKSGHFKTRLNCASPQNITHKILPNKTKHHKLSSGEFLWLDFFYTWKMKQREESSLFSFCCLSSKSPFFTLPIGLIGSSDRRNGFVSVFLWSRSLLDWIAFPFFAWRMFQSCNWQI
jgi:hypothetical protein